MSKNRTPQGSILALFLSRRDAITLDKCVDSTAELEEGVDNVIDGVFPDELKKTYTLFCQLSDEHDAVVKKAHELLHGAMDGVPTLKGMSNLGKIEGELADLHVQHQELHTLKGLAKKIFWTDVRRAFPEADEKGSNIKLLKGWRVAWQESDPMDELASRLGEVLGGHVHILGGRDIFDSLRPKPN